MNKFLKLLGIFFGLLLVASLVIWWGMGNSEPENAKNVVYKGIEDRIDAFVNGPVLRYDDFIEKYDDLADRLEKDTVHNAKINLKRDLLHYSVENMKNEMISYCKSRPLDTNGYKAMVNRTKTLMSDLTALEIDENTNEKLATQLKDILYQSVDKARKARNIIRNIDDSKTTAFSSSRYDDDMNTIQSILSAQYVSENSNLRRKMNDCKRDLNTWKVEYEWFADAERNKYKEILTRPCSEFINEVYKTQCKSHKRNVFMKFLGLKTISDLDVLLKNESDPCVVLSLSEKASIKSVNCRDIQVFDRDRDQYFIMCMDILDLPCLLD